MKAAKKSAMPRRTTLVQNLKSLTELSGIAASSPREMIEARVRAAIVDGRFKPGERITQQSIANLFNVSRMPVREALRMLETQGYVTGELNKGYIVAHGGINPRADHLPSLLRVVGEHYTKLDGPEARAAFENEILRLVGVNSTRPDTDARPA